MSDARVIAPLGDLLRALVSSLPQYLAECWPWTHRGDSDAYQVIKQIIAEQQQRAGQVADLILKGGGQLESSTFPEEWTSLNYVALDYLLVKLVEDQQSRVTHIEGIRDLLPGASDERTLAAAIAEDARRHLEQLKDLASRHRYSQQASVITPE